jgi:hypothetical protein
MEADDILMNISEIESPNYEYLEINLLNLPRDLLTNLNSGLFLAIVETSSGFRSSCYWTNRNRANTETIRIWLFFVVLAQWKFIYCSKEKSREMSVVCWSWKWRDADQTETRELKNSEDVQDALIEDYFRYNDLSRMEADDILNILSIFQCIHLFSWGVLFILCFDFFPHFYLYIQ